MASNGIKRPIFCVKVIIERGSESRATQGTANALRAAAQRKQAQRQQRRRRNKAAQEPNGNSADRATSPSKRKPQDCTPRGKQGGKRTPERSTAADKNNSAAIRPGTESKRNSNERILLDNLILGY